MIPVAVRNGHLISFLSIKTRQMLPVTALGSCRSSSTGPHPNFPMIRKTDIQKMPRSIDRGISFHSVGRLAGYAREATTIIQLRGTVSRPISSQVSLHAFCRHSRAISSGTPGMTPSMKSWNPLMSYQPSIGTSMR